MSELSPQEKLVIAGTNGSGKIQTLTGAAFSPVEPELDDIYIHDIAGALAKQCRFAGHCLRFYSVAEHCCLVYDWLAKQEFSTDVLLAGLMHDASEAYLVDIPRPLKPFLTGYREIEDHLMAQIAVCFDFPYPLPAPVKEADNRILFDERDQNMAQAEHPEIWGAPLEPLGMRLNFWMPTQAELQFIQRYNDLVDNR